jgi:signal transduction histidine kinase
MIISHSRTLPPSRILVVDDEVAHLQALEHVLRELGHEVTACSSPHLALEHLTVQQYDVLLSDLRMPEMDGITLMGSAMALDPDLVAVLMTGYSSVDSAVQAMKAGALDYVLKPFRLAALQPVLDRALQMRRLRVENRRLTAQLQRRAKELEAANAELDKFATRVAHDLRAPLNVISGFAEALAHSAGARLDEGERSHLDRIQSAGQRANRLVGSMLTFARLGDGPFLRQRVALGAIVHQAREGMVVRADKHAGTIAWQIADLPSVDGDPFLLEQVFVNLLSNAVKYTREIAAPRIDVHAEHRSEVLRVIVADNGAGFDPARKGELFNPFVRLHDAKRFEGTGMGLANVRRIMERHGGSVTADAELGKGASFVLHFPAVKGE